MIESAYPAPLATATPAKPPRTWGAIAVLLLLATITGESIASFNTPPSAYLAKPATGPWLLAFYGLGVLLARDLARLRRRGWVSLALFGVAFGALNEGLIAATWFQPSGSPVEYLTIYSRVAGVNIIWAMMLTIYHTIYSVVIPIILAEACFPRLADRPWLGRAGRWICAILFALTCLLGLKLPSYHSLRVGALLLAIVLVALGLALRQRGQTTPAAASLPARGAAKPAPRLWTLRALGFASTILFFLTLYLLPHLIPSPVALGALIVLMCAGAIWRVKAWSRRPGWSQRHTLALASGAISFGIALGFAPPFLFAAEPALGLPYLALLIALAWRLRRMSAREARA